MHRPSGRVFCFSFWSITVWARRSAGAGPLGGNIAVGLLWALWHLPLFWLPGSYQYGDSILLFLLLLTCWSIVIGMLVSKSGGSILPAILLHEAANFIAFNFRYPGSYYGYLVWMLAAGLAVLGLPRPLWNWPWRHVHPQADH